MSVSKFAIKNAEIMNRAPKVVLEFIENWKENARKFYTSKVEEFLNADKNLRVMLSGSDEFSSREDTKIHEELGNLYKKYFNEFGWMIYYAKHPTGDMTFAQEIEKIITNEAERKLVKFILTVEKKAGKILDADMLYIGSDLSINGYVRGEIKNVKVWTIFAGGYNIQCLHYRVLVK